MACNGSKLVEVLLLFLMVKMVQNLDIGHDGLGSPLLNIKMEVYLVNGIVMLIIQEFRCLYDFSLCGGPSLSPCSFLGSRKVLPIRSSELYSAMGLVAD